MLQSSFSPPPPRLPISLVPSGRLTYHFQSRLCIIFPPGVVGHTHVGSAVLRISQHRDGQRAVVVVDGVTGQFLSIHSGPVTSRARMTVDAAMKSERFGCFMSQLSFAVLIAKASDPWSLCEDGKSMLNSVLHFDVSYYNMCCNHLGLPVSLFILYLALNPLAVSLSSE